MKIQLKRIAWVLSAVMLVSSLAGCGGGTISDENGGEITLGSYEPKSDKRYKISWTYYQNAPMKQDAVMKKFWEDKFNVEMDVWDIENNRSEEILNLRMSSGEIPDKFSAKTMVAMKNYVAQGVVTEIPMEVLEKYAPNLLRRIEQDVPGALEYCKVDGKLYALPTYTMNIARNPIVWRGDWLEKVGITKTPETIDEFEAAIYKFAKENPGGVDRGNTYGLSSTGLMSVYLAYGYLPIVKGVTDTGGQWRSRDGELVYSSVQPEMKEALARIRRWYADGIIDPEFVTGENQGGYWALSHAFINGRIGLTSLGQTYHWEPRFYETRNSGVGRDELSKLDPEAAKSLVIGVPPIGPNGARGANANPFIKEEKVMFGKNLINEPDKLGRILTMLDWVYESKANHLTATKGIEGTMWEWRERTSLFDGKNYREVVSLGEYEEGSVLNANFAHTAMSIFEPSFADENPPRTAEQEWEYSVGSDKYRASTELMVALPSQSKYSVELNKLEEEAYLEIITGRKPLDYFDEFVTRWRSLGGSVLEKEAQEWYATIKK